MTWYTSRPSLVGRIIYQAKITRQGRSFGTSTQAHLKLAYDLYEPSSSRAKGDDCHPIVFLHGLFGSKKNNRSISKVLARDLGRPVFALDLRNHGESPHDRHHDYTSMASDVAGFIIDHNLDEPTIIGHSMGAKTAMALALRSPDLVRNIISVDNAPVDAVLESGFGNYVEGMKRIERAGVMRQAEADEILKNHEENPEETRFEKPALFIRGTRSKYVADDVLPLIGQFFPRFRLIDVDAGHWLISENPEAFREAVVDFLSTSKGAKTAMALALRSPNLVRNIISVDNAPVDAVLESGFGTYVEGMKRIERAGVMRQAEADDILKNYEESLPVRQFLLANLYRPQPNKPQQFRVPLDILGRSLGHMADFPFKNPEETRFEKPALFIRGTRSKYVADDVLPLIGQFFPRFRLVDVDAGHWLISEKPEAFREAVVDFLSTSK
ncbi:alcohol acetyltransferase like protein [Verticillium longisporum]|nr:alcohol acetyltransferase like protein [Verticillium longisporum]